MTGIKDVLAKALPLCNPTAAEAKKVTAIAEEAIRLVKHKVPSEVSDVLFGGSFAKGTWLRGDADIDIFIKVNASVDEKRFEELGVKIGNEALKKFDPHLRYSDHPYVEAILGEITINVVPCYDVQIGQWKSAADRSPFHTRYIANNFNEAKKNEVRLLKKFFKAAGIYGAEISTGGFSGYVSEVLVSKYGSFENVLSAAAEFKQGQVIAVNDFDPDVVKGFQSPIIIIDPIDPRRNLGTAISPESVGRFMLAARSFLARPSLRFFGTQKARLNMKLYPNVLVVEFSHRERSPDTIWGQMKRSLNSLSKQFELAGFTVIRASCITDEKTSGVFAFLLESLTLPPYVIRKGPEIARSKDIESFLAKGHRPLAMWADREMRVSMLTERKATDAGKFVRSLLQENVNAGVAKNMITGGLRIYSGDKRMINGLVKAAVDDIVSTESLIFGN